MLRVVEIKLQVEDLPQLLNLIKDKSVIISENTLKDKAEVKLLLSAEITEHFLDEFNRIFADHSEFSVIIMNVEASMPAYEDKEPDRVFNMSEDSNISKNNKKLPVRLSREELFFEVNNSVRLSKIYIALIICSSLVAAIGLITDNIAIIVGSMVIAPFLGPNIAISFSIATADRKLFRKAVLTNFTGLVVAALSSVIIGFAFNPDLSSTQLQQRIHITSPDIALALISGIAGSLAFDTRISTALVGVMVSVALLPPLAAAGLFLGAGQFNDSLGAFMLFIVNLAGINLSGLATFKTQKIRPRKDKDSKKANIASLLAFLFWAILLLLVILI